MENSSRKGGKSLSHYTEAIVRLVQNARNHPTAEQIFLEMKNSYPNVALATVYNNLNALCRSGAVRRITVEGAPDRYDRPQRHDHMVCRVCGGLADVTLQDLTEMIERQTGESILSYDLQIRYICPRCRANTHADHGEQRSKQDE